MKISKKTNLNVGVQSCIKDRELIVRVVVQQKGIDWSYANTVLTIQVKPTLLLLGDSMDWRKNTRTPYQVYLNNNHHTTMTSWKDALEYLNWHVKIMTDSLGLPSVDFVKEFQHREPKITFGEVFKILRKNDIQIN